MISRWRGQPAPLRAVVLLLVVALTCGTVVHLVQLLTSGGNPYPGLPTWLSTYFVSLTVLDPLAALLLERRHRAGVVLTVAVLVTDATADALANYTYDPTAGITTGRIGQAVITCLALGALAAAPAMWRSAPSEHRTA
ncbi:hypothetical protein WDZ17_16585 [Pseudokineococcus basanitobsidens]|uniref:Uncharacterized protein n=1 Tax=Pseudokineococcus basanitobsidens TaxID=1926649 RepID=A0ABU8RP79_9ACTN